MIFSYYRPNRDPENLSVFKIYVIVDSKINLFLFVSNRRSPYSSVSLFSLSESETR